MSCTNCQFCDHSARVHASYHFSSFPRVVYREDLVKLKEQLHAKQDVSDDEQDGSDDGGKKPVKKRRGIKSRSSQGMKDEPPKNSLSLEFVHGYVWIGPCG